MFFGFLTNQPLFKQRWSGLTLSTVERQVPLDNKQARGGGKDREAAQPVPAFHGPLLSEQETHQREGCSVHKMLRFRTKVWVSVTLQIHRWGDQPGDDSIASSLRWWKVRRWIDCLWCRHIIRHLRTKCASFCLVSCSFVCTFEGNERVKMCRSQMFLFVEKES